MNNENKKVKIFKFIRTIIVALFFICFTVFIFNSYGLDFEEGENPLRNRQVESEKTFDSEEERILSEHSDIRDIIKDICNINEGKNKDDILNSDAMINRIFDGIIDSINDFNNSSLHSVITGIGVLILLTNFSFSFYQNMPNIERRTTEQIMRMMFQFIMSCFIIANCGRLLNMAIGISQFLLNKSILLKNDIITSSNNLSISDEITILLIKEAGLHKKGILDKFLGAGRKIVLFVQLLIPWIICLISKFGLIFAPCKIAIETVVYAMFYPLAAGDCYENIKHSNFMKYTKHIFASLMQMAIIVLILYASNNLLSNIVQEIVTKIPGEKRGDTVFEILVLLSVIQLSKTAVVMSSSSVIAHKVFGE